MKIRQTVQKSSISQRLRLTGDLLPFDQGRVDMARLLPHSFAMSVLAIDTCGDQCAAAACAASGPISSAQQLMARGHAEALPGLVVEALEKAGISYGDLERIVVTVGPGSFSGVRVGLSMARGLAVVLKIPVVGVSTLRAIAASDDGADLSAARLVAIDAKRGEVYAQLFRDGQSPDAQPIAVALQEDLGEIIDRIEVETGTIRLIGSGAALLARQETALASLYCPDGPVRPDIAALCDLGSALVPDGFPPKPLYIRPPDAKPMSLTSSIVRA